MTAFMSWEGRMNTEKEFRGRGGEENSRGLHFYLILTVLNVLCYLFWELITSSSLLCRQTYLELFGAQRGHDSLFILLHFPQFPYQREITNE